MLLVVPLPFQEFIGRQAVATAGIGHGQEAAMNGGDHFRFAARHPPHGVGRRQVKRRQHVSIWSDDDVLGSSVSHRAALISQMPPSPWMQNYRRRFNPESRRTG